MNRHIKSKAEKTRDLIIQKAAPIFNKKGYAGTSLSDLLKSTGLTKGSIYGNFKNKDEIALEAFQHNFAWIRASLIAAASAKSNSIDKLLAIINFYRQEYSKMSAQGGCPILNTAIESDDNMPLLRSKVQESLIGWKMLIDSIIIQGKIKKEIRPDADSSHYSVMLIALIEGGIMLAKITNEPSNLFVVLDKGEKIIKDDLSV